MMSVAEKTGNVSDMMGLVAEHYDAEVKYALKNLTTMIEPILLFVLGGMVLFFALAVFLPMWDMMKVFGT